MKKETVILLLALIVIALVWAWAPWRSGPAERAGEQLDQMAHDTRNAVRDTGHDIKHDLTH